MNKLFFVMVIVLSAASINGATDGKELTDAEILKRELREEREKLDARQRKELENEVAALRLAYQEACSANATFAEQNEELRGRLKSALGKASSSRLMEDSFLKAVQVANGRSWEAVAIIKVLASRLEKVSPRDEAAGLYFGKEDADIFSILSAREEKKAKLFETEQVFEGSSDAAAAP